MKEFIKYALKLLLFFSLGMLVCVIFSASLGLMLAAAICFYGSILAINTLPKKRHRVVVKKSPHEV